VLTDSDGEDEPEQPDLEEDGGGRPWWPARSPCDGDDSVDLWRRNKVPRAWLGVTELLVVTPCSGDAYVRRIERQCRRLGQVDASGGAVQGSRRGARAVEGARAHDGQGASPLISARNEVGRGVHAKAVVAAQQLCCLLAMGSAGPAAGSRWAEVDRVGSGLRARPRRKGMVFFLFSKFIFNAKTIPLKTRNCLKARKILRKSQKFQKNSQRPIGTRTI
jgi:hypothetical protein